MVVFGDKVTKILCNSLFTFFNEQGKTGKTENKVKKITQPKLQKNIISKVPKFEMSRTLFRAIGLTKICVLWNYLHHKITESVVSKNHFNIQCRGLTQPSIHLTAKRTEMH